MLPGAAANKLLGELGVGYGEVVRRISEEGMHLVAAEDRRPRELPHEGGRSSESPTRSTR
jgi:hypothetical protein